MCEFADNQRIRPQIGGADRASGGRIGKHRGQPFVVSRGGPAREQQQCKTA